MRSFWFESLFTKEGWLDRVRLTVVGGLVARLEPGVSPEPEDQRLGLGAPGLSNGHSHGFQRALAGLAERRGPLQDSFWTWREVMYRFLARLTPDDVEAITALAFVEMLEAGFTRVGEFHYLHNDPAGRSYEDAAEMAHRVVAAAEMSGIGLTLLPVFYAHSGFGGLEPSQGQRRFIQTLDGFDRLMQAAERSLATLPDGVMGVAPHSLRAVTETELVHLVRQNPGRLVHIHIAEQTGEVDDCLAFSGQRPVEWLLNHLPVGQGWSLVHATHLVPEERSALAQSGAVAVLCPLTEANLGDGVFPTAEFLQEGGRIAIGTDSNVLISAAEELRLLEYAQRLTRRQRNVLAPDQGGSTGARLLRQTLAGGVDALGSASRPLAHPLEPGAPADFITFAADHVSMIGRRGGAVIDSWIFSSGPGAVDGVWRRGEALVTGGRHRAGEAVKARYRVVLEGLLQA